MTRLLEKAGIDRQHFRALLRLAWRLDMRQSKLGFGISRKGKKPVFTFLFAIAFYFFFGIVFATTCHAIEDIFVAATIITSIIMFMMASIMLVEYNAIIISPNDFAILGYMPITSRTYFVTKLLNLLFYTLTFTLILGGPTAIVLATRNGFTIFKLITAFATVLGSGIFVTLIIVSLYSFLLKLISPQRLKQLLSYLQFGLALLIYLGYLIIPNLLSRYTADFQMEKSNWLLAAPTSWFSSFLLIGHGYNTIFEIFGVALALSATGFLFYFAISRLSLSYAEKLANLSVISGNDNKKRSPIQGNSYRLLAKVFAVETRVVWRLLRGQFRHDLKFRFSVLGMLPILIVYFYLGLQQGSFSDPFLSGSASLQNFGVFFFAILIMPMIMKNNIETSAAYEASWVFYTSSADLAKLVFASRNLLFVLFSLPGLILIFFIFTFYFLNWANALLHIFTLTLLCFFIIQTIYFINPKLPFSEPKTRGAQSKLNMLIFILIPTAGLILLQGITANFYYQRSSLFLFYIGLIALILLFEKLTHLRILNRARKLTFESAK
ncbi:MAG: hypothetical protein DWQ05_20580 [Calditrichaeota bacterium]|nr:MAG: hypothetical protein DWQ05_20580 [Calditrichota bacterium]